MREREAYWCDQWEAWRCDYCHEQLGTGVSPDLSRACYCTRTGRAQTFASPSPQEERANG